MGNQRTFKRFQLVTTFPVMDPAGVKQLGVVIDISAEGLGVRVVEAMEPQRRYGLRVVLPEAIGGEHSVLLNTTCRWCRRSSNPDLFDAGFSLEEITPDIAELIEQLIQRFGR